MKPAKVLILFYLGVLFTYSLTGCVGTTEEPLNTPLPKKDPLTVTFYNQGEKPLKPYQILGEESISKYNFVGIRRQQASIHDSMRNLAASMGGDAIINIRHDDKTIHGTIIALQPTTKIKT